MMNTNTGFFHRTLHRVLNYKRSVAYWQRQERDLLSQDECLQESNTGLPNDEGFLTAYRTFVAQTLENYKADVRLYADSVDIEPLLRRCSKAMRREMEAEAERLSDQFRQYIGDEVALKNSVHQMTEAAVTQLTEIMECADSPSGIKCFG